MRSIQGLVGWIHQRSWGSVYCGPSATNASTSPRLEGLKMCRPRQRIKYLESMEIATTPRKIQIPRRLHHCPCRVPGTRRMKATLLPVSKPLAGHMIALSLKNATVNSMSAPAARQARICATESRKSSTVCPRTWSVSSTAATCSRASRMLGRSTRYVRPANRIVLPPPMAG